MSENVNKDLEKIEAIVFLLVTLPLLASTSLLVLTLSYIKIKDETEGIP